MKNILILLKAFGIALPFLAWWTSRELAGSLALGTTLYPAAITLAPLVIGVLLVYLFGGIGRWTPLVMVGLVIVSGVLGIRMEWARWGTGVGSYRLTDIVRYLDWPLMLASISCLAFPALLVSRTLGLGWSPMIGLAPSTIFGGSEWMSVSEAKQKYRGGELVIGEAYDLQRREGVPGQAQLLTASGDGHLLTVGGAGSGKTTTVVVPNCLNWTGPLVVLDPKGELSRLCRRSREGRGRRVASINPDDAASDTLNILSWIDPRDDRIVSDVELVVSWLMEGHGDAGSNRVFEDQARSLITAVIIDSLADSSIPASEKNLHAVSRRLAPDVIEATLIFMDAQPDVFPFDSVRSIAAGFIDQRKNARETWEGVYLYVTGALAFLRSPGNARVLSGGGRAAINVEELPRGALDVFVAVPLRILDTSPAVGRLLIGCLVTSVIRHYEREQQRGAQDVLFLLDEMPRLRKMTVLETARDAGRGYGIRLWAIVQDFGQLKQWYGDNGLQSWLANARIQTFIGISDPETAKWLSDRMGTTTRLAKNAGGQTGRSRWDVFSSSGGANTGQTETSVPLMHPGDIMQMRTDSVGLPDEQIVVMRNERPLRCGVARYQRRPEMVQAVN